jgi:uncharacterized membrane protein YedE/YeeE
MSEEANHSKGARDYWNPYAAGVALGLVLLASYVILGYGLGASGAASRFSAAAVEAVAPAHAQETYFANYFREGMSPLNNWIVFGVLGVFLGGLVGSVTAGRHARGITAGPRISPSWRLVLALSGGIVMGFAARIARGCTSGQALSGGALLSAGSWIFMMAVFAGGYALAWFLRRQWT